MIGNRTSPAAKIGSELSTPVTALNGGGETDQWGDSIPVTWSFSQGT